MVSLMPRPVYFRGTNTWYSLSRRLDGPQSQYGRFGEPVASIANRTTTPRSPALSLVTILTVLKKYRTTPPPLSLLRFQYFTHSAEFFFLGFACCFIKVCMKKLNSVFHVTEIRSFADCTWNLILAPKGWIWKKRKNRYRTANRLGRRQSFVNRDCKTVKLRNAEEIGHDHFHPAFSDFIFDFAHLRWPFVILFVTCSQEGSGFIALGHVLQPDLDGSRLFCTWFGSDYTVFSLWSRPPCLVSLDDQSSFGLKILRLHRVIRSMVPWPVGSPRGSLALTMCGVGEAAVVTSPTVKTFTRKVAVRKIGPSICQKHETRRYKIQKI